MTSSEAADRTAVVRAQEEMRREIARQMHDGPAQSLANIALQSEIVQRLASRGDARTPAELEAAAPDGQPRAGGDQGVHLRGATDGP